MTRSTLRSAACRLAASLRRAGHRALFAGGCVRDRLRGTEPKDYDIATSARPEEVEALFPRTVGVGAAFGVVVVVEEEASFEVATFRRDVGVKDGRHPGAVEYSDEKTDALRRDFTINGLFEDPETGEVLDYVGGRRDLAARTVRAIGDPALRFREDRLRLLRAVRFATVLDFTIDRNTADELRRQGTSVGSVSAERIREELTRILVSGRGGRGLGLLDEFGMLPVLLPEVAALKGVQQPPEFHPEGDVFTHTRMLLDDFAGEAPEVALAALFHDVGKPPTRTRNDKGRIAFPNHAPLGAELAERAMRRLRYANREIEQVKELVRHHMDWPNVPKMRPAKRKRFLLRPDFPLHLELHRLDCRASHGLLDLYEECRRERRRLEEEPPPLRPLLDGHALVGLGFSPGPAFKTMLESLLDAQLEGVLKTPDEARSFILERFRPPDGRPIAGEHRT